MCTYLQICVTIYSQIPRGVDDIRKVVDQINDLTQRIETAKELSMVCLMPIYLSIGHYALKRDGLSHLVREFSSPSDCIIRLYCMFIVELG